MAIRICPHCLKKVPAGPVVAYTDRLECPHCHSPITVGVPSRVIGAFIGLGIGELVWKYVQPMGGEAGWVLPALYAFLAYSVVYTLYLMATADLVMRPVESEPAAVVADAHGHGAGHH